MNKIIVPSIDEIIEINEKLGYSVVNKEALDFMCLYSLWKLTLGFCISAYCFEYLAINIYLKRSYFLCSSCLF